MTVTCSLIGGRAFAAPPLPRLVVDVEDRADRVDPWEMFAAGDLAYFLLDETTTYRPTLEPEEVEIHTRSLWRSEGSRGTTFELLPHGVEIVKVVDTLGDVVFFVGCSRGHETPPEPGALCLSVEDWRLWQSDGDGSRTLPLLLGTDSSLRETNAGVAVPELGLFFFDVRDDQGHWSLWVTDGTPGGARPAVDLSAFGLKYFSHPVAFNGRLVYDGFAGPGTPNNGTVLIETDGTPEGTVSYPGPFDGRVGIQQLVATGDRLYALVAGPDAVTVGTGERRPLWTLWSGRSAGSLHLFGYLGYRSQDSYKKLIGAGGRAFVSFYDREAGGELWGSDGTVAGTGRLFAEPEHGGWLGRFEGIRELPGGKVPLSVSDKEHGREPWTSDGSPLGTHLVADLCPGSCSSNPSEITIFDGGYLFVADDGTHGRELWRWDPSTGRVAMLNDLCTDRCRSVLSVVAVGDDLVVVRTSSDYGGRDLWSMRADGSEVYHVADLWGFRQESYLAEPLRVDGTWYFWGRDREQEHLGLWAVDLPRAAGPPPPSRPPLTSAALPGFDVWVEISPGTGDPIPGRAEIGCIPETLCVSGAIPGRSEVFVRVVGPKPNGRLWPTLVKFSTSTVEVWIEQRSTGLLRYYRMEGASPGSSDLPGLFDRNGFPPS